MHSKILTTISFRLRVNPSTAYSKKIVRKKLKKLGSKDFYGILSSYICKYSMEGCWDYTIVNDRTFLPIDIYKNDGFK